MRNCFAFLLAGTVLLSLAACVSTADPSVSPGPAPPPLWTDTAAEPPAAARPADPEGAVSVPAAAVGTPVVTETPVPVESDRIPETEAPETPPAADAGPSGISAALTEVTLLQSLTVYDGKGGAASVLPAGTALRVAGAAEAEWLYGETDSAAFWLHLDSESGFQVETPAGFLFLWAVMDGLSFTD